eukprot:5658587-Ditylum_brightwellii.AAC.1
MERSKQNKHAVCNKDDNVDDGVDNGDDNSADNGDNDGADKHLTHLSQAADYCLMDRSKQNKHAVCDKDNDVDDGVDNGVDKGDDDGVGDGDDDSVDNGYDSADKHLKYLSEAADCCLTERSKQNEHVLCNEDNDVDDGVDNGVDDEKSKQNKHVVCHKDNDVDDGDDDVVNNGNDESVDNGDDDGVDKFVENDDDNCNENIDKHLTHLSQAADCCLMERRKQNKHADCNKDNYVDN